MSSFQKQKPSMPSQSNHSKSASLPSSSSSQQQPIINYEEYLEANYNSIDKELANLLLFPSDEIQLIEIKKKCSTIEQLKPECEVDVDHNINDCLRSYNSNHKCIVKNYVKYSSCYLNDQKKQMLVQTCKVHELQEFESDLPNEEQERSEQDEHLLLTPTGDNLNLLDSTNKQNDQIRAKKRPNLLFNFYPVQQSSESIHVESRLIPNPPVEHICNRILVKCTQLKFELELEPVWATMCLYDLKEKRKISENFTFDLNSETMKQMLHTHQTHIDQSTLAKSSIFNVTYPSADIFFVIRIEKVLQQGDIGECIEPYMKTQSVSGIEKLQQNANQFCERLGKYRMPFVWTAINIMSLLNSNQKSDTLNGTSAEINSPQQSQQQQKSASLDRRFVNNSVLNNEARDCDKSRHTEPYDLSDSEAGFEGCDQSRPQALKSAYEAFRKTGGNNECVSGVGNKRNSLVNTSGTTSGGVPLNKANSFNGNKNSQINNPQHDELQNSLSNRLNKFKPIAITVNTFFKQESDKLSDEDLFRALNDLKKQTNLVKKLKCVPGYLKMEFSPYNYDLTDTHNNLNNNYILSPELQLLKLNQTLVNSERHSQGHYHQPLLMHNHLLPIKNILEFPSRPVYEPNYLYRNLLYIYPGTINLCGASNIIRSGGTSTSVGSLNQNLLVSSQSSARNIAIKINLMKGEEEHCALPVLFAKSSSTSEYCKEVFVNVVYHNKTPQYHDEIKIKLPALLNEGTYHLLFTFYHVSCQNSKDQNQLESIIGYSWLPIQQQFQTDTNIQFNSDIQPFISQQSAEDSSPSIAGQSSLNQQQNSNSQLSQTNRGSMIKNGTYSLPICFEKLSAGYSNLNYSVFNTNTTSNEVFDLNEIDLESLKESNDTSSDFADISSVNINTVVNNINCSNLACNNLTGSNAKSFFDVGMKLVSTIHPQDVYLERFISLANQMRDMSGQKQNQTAAKSNIYGAVNSRFSVSEAQKLSSEEALEVLLKKAMGDVCLAESEALVKFLFVILDKLLFFILSPSASLRSKCLEVTLHLVFRITNLISNQNDPHRRNRLLVQYSQYACNLPISSPNEQVLFHEQLLTEWLKLLNNSKQSRLLKELLMQTSGFFLDILFKSMSIYLNTATHCLTNKPTNQLNAFKSAKMSLNTFCTQILSPGFIADLELLIHSIILELICLQKISLSDGQNRLSNTLNCSLAFFLLDLFSIIDRGLIFRKIEFYFKETNQSLAAISNLIFQLQTSTQQQQQITGDFNLISFKNLHSLQLDFLRVLSSHEHFIALNLPLFFDQSFNKTFHSKRFIIETNDYFNKHFLIGLVLRQLYKSLHSSFASIQYKSIHVLRNIIETNDIDPRLSGNQKARAMISYMYMPFLNMFIHFIPLMVKKQKNDSQKHNDSDLNHEDQQQDVSGEDMDSLTGHLSDMMGAGNFVNELESRPADLTCDSEFIETSLNLDEFDVDLDRNEFFNIDDVLNEDYIAEANEKLSRHQSTNSFGSVNSSTSNGVKNFRKLSQDVVKVNHLIKTPKGSKPTIPPKTIDSSKKSTSQYILKKSRPCCDFYNLRLNLIQNQKNSLDSTATFSVETTQDLLICFLWILKNMDKELLFRIWKKWSYVKLKKILVLFDLCINHFEYRSTIWSDFMAYNHQQQQQSETPKSVPIIKTPGSSSASNVTSQKNQQKLKQFSVNSNEAHRRNENKSDYTFFKRAKYFKGNESGTDLLFYDLNDCVSSLKKNNNNSSNSSRTGQDLDEMLSSNDKTVLEGNLSTECMLIVSDGIELIIEIIQCHEKKQQSNNSSNKTPLPDALQTQNLLKNLTKLLLNSLNSQQSTRALANLFNIQRDLVRKFSDLLFEQDTEYCSDICTILLKHCTSQLVHIRAQSSASLYSLMRQNFEIGNNFSQVKIQLTMGLSSLVTGFNSADQKLTVLSEFLNVKSLKNALKLILTYADNDMEFSETSFPAQVKDLILNLNTILCDTVKMKEFQDDNEMIIDLMYRIAGCYQSSPDMRLIWLQNMAQKHLERQNLAEAGQCLIHAAALVAEYLSMIENRSYLPVGCASFRHVTINVLEESAISDDVIQSIQGICTGKYFSETGLIGLVEQAAVFLMHSQNYEVANQLYKILIPIYEHHRDIKKLSQVHSKLHDCFNKILLNGARRLFGTYFRVGFYGHRFEDISGEEFIYKEPGITKLSEIAHRLENFYGKKFGESCVEIMKDSNNVDQKTLDLVNKAYIQITYVEPYFDRWEAQKCTTFFEKNYSLKRFIYSTPFTLEGRAHGSLKEQFKRKTILTTERAFPYVKLRIGVIDKQQIILQPVEVAIEDLQKKIEELRNATHQEPIDSKILQMVMQGCVGTTVNQGPLEMALAFLKPMPGDTITEHHNKLRLCFKEFSRRCLEALVRNKSLIGPDQYEYQREMERNYNEMKLNIDPLIENSAFKE